MDFHQENIFRLSRLNTLISRLEVSAVPERESHLLTSGH